MARSQSWSVIGYLTTPKYVSVIDLWAHHTYSSFAFQCVFSVLLCCGIWAANIQLIKEKKNLISETFWWDSSLLITSSFAIVCQRIYVEPRRRVWREPETWQYNNNLLPVKNKRTNLNSISVVKAETNGKNLTKFTA